MLSCSGRRNIAISAHIDAGKTTLSERMLFFSRTIESMGEVEDGMSVMDFLEEEQRRGITVDSAIASFKWKNSQFTFIDTPGHIDFSADVDFALQGVENVLVIVSGDRGIETQTEEVWKKVRRHMIRPIVFINKLDIEGLNFRAIVKNIRKDFQIKPVLMTFPVYKKFSLVGICDLLNEAVIYQDKKDPRFFTAEPVFSDIFDTYYELRNELIDAATLKDQDLTNDYLEGKTLDRGKIAAGLNKTFCGNDHVPVYLGSALKNIGIRQLLNGFHQFLVPPYVQDGILAQVLKIHNIGELNNQHIIKLHSRVNGTEKPFEKMFSIQADELSPTEDEEAGTILSVMLKSDWYDCRPGDIIKSDYTIVSEKRFGVYHPPLIQTRIEVRQIDDYSRVSEVITNLSGRDPSVRLKEIESGGGWLLHTVGEVQLEIFCERLQKASGCLVNIGTPETKNEERLEKSLFGVKNTAQRGGVKLTVILDLVPFSKSRRNEFISKNVDMAPKYTGVFQSVLSQVCERGIIGAGSLTGIKVILKSMESNIEKIPFPLLHKCLFDCLSMNLKEKHIGVFEPFMRMEVLVPNEFCGNIIQDLTARGGLIKKVTAQEKKTLILLKISLKRVFGYAKLLRALSKGQGTYFLVYDKHERVN